MSVINITKTIAAPVHEVFSAYLNPEDNLRWNTAGNGWTTSFANISPVAGGEFHIGYKSPDEQQDFDFGGVYDEIIENQIIKYTLGDSRKVEVSFRGEADKTIIAISFETEDENSAELQKTGWGMVLENFKKHVERKANSKNAIINKNILIKATKDKVWNSLLNPETYKQWSSSFMPGSYYKGEMGYNHKIWFLSPNGIGIASQIVVFIPNFQVSFEHLGDVSNGQEDLQSSQFESWKGARETYTLNGKDGEVDLNIYVETIHDEFSEMDRMWDQALTILKQICEQNA